MRWWRRRDAQLESAADAAVVRDSRLSAFLDGDLGSTEADTLAAELAADAELREALEGMRAVKSALGTLGDVPAPRAFTLSAPPVSAPKRLSRLELGARVGAVAAAVAFVLVLGVDLGTSTGGGQLGRTAAGDAASSASKATSGDREQLAAPRQGAPAAGDGAGGEPAASPAMSPAPAGRADTGTAASAPMPASTPASAAGEAASPGFTGGAGGAIAPTIEPGLPQPDTGREWRVTVERRAAFDGTRAAEAGLAGLTLALGAAAAALWYMRHRRSASP